MSRAGTATTGALLRRWKGLSRRRRWGLGLLVLFAVGVAGWSLWPGEGWPARAVLRTTRDTWPLGFSPDGATFATSGGDGITLWDVATGAKRATWTRPVGGFAGLAVFSQDGRLFAVGEYQPEQRHIVRVLDVTTGREVVSPGTRLPDLYALGFSADGRSLHAILGEKGRPREVQVWDVASGEEVARRPISCKVNTGPVAFTPDGRLMACCAFASSVVTVWDLEADRERFVLRGTPGTPRASAVGLSPDGRILAVGREDGTIELRDLASGRLVSTLRGHSPGHDSWGLNFSADGAVLASRGDFRRPATPIDHLRSILSSIVVGRRIDKPGEVVAWDIASGRRLGRAGSAIHPFPSPDGRRVATREMDFTVRLRDVRPARRD